MLFQFFCQTHLKQHTVEEAVAFMVTAEDADRIYDPIHLPERHAVHQFVKLVEILFDLVIIHQIDFAVGLGFERNRWHIAI